MIYAGDITDESFEQLDERGKRAFRVACYLVEEGLLSAASSVWDLPLDSFIEEYAEMTADHVGQIVAAADAIAKRLGERA